MCCVFLLNVCLFGNTSSLTRITELSKYEEPPDGRSLRGYYCRVRFNDRKARPYELKNYATRMKTRRVEPVEVIRSEQEPHGTCRRTENIIGTVDSAMRGTLVRRVSPAEEPAESAVRKALVCKEPPAAQAQGLRDESKNQRRG